jgi:hypothetical protein
MLLRVDNRRARYALFFLLALTINLLDSLVTRSIENPAKRLLVAVAASVDVVAVVSLIYYWLLVRPGIRTRGSLIAVSLLGLVHATYFFPDTNAIKLGLAGLCELGLIAFIVMNVRGQARRSQPDADPVDAIHSSLAGIVPSPVAHAIAGEISVLYYALFSWLAKPHVPAHAKPFTIHEQSGAAEMLNVLAIACLFEILPAHILIHRWSTIWAWVATALSLYSVVWLIGLARSIVLSPLLVGPDHVDFRYGLLFRLRVPKEMITGVRRLEPGAPTPFVVLPRRSEPNLSIALANEMDAQGPFGIRKRVGGLAIAADDCAALQCAIGQP